MPRTIVKRAVSTMAVASADSSPACAASDVGSARARSNGDSTPASESKAARTASMWGRSFKRGTVELIVQRSIADRVTVANVAAAARATPRRVPAKTPRPVTGTATRAAHSR